MNHRAECDRGMGGGETFRKPKNSQTTEKTYRTTSTQTKKTPRRPVPERRKPRTNTSKPKRSTKKKRNGKRRICRNLENTFNCRGVCTTCSRNNCLEEGKKTEESTQEGSAGLSRHGRNGEQELLSADWNYLNPPRLGKKGIGEKAEKVRAPTLRCKLRTVKRLCSEEGKGSISASSP